MTKEEVREEVEIWLKDDGKVFFMDNLKEKIAYLLGMEIEFYGAVDNEWRCSCKDNEAKKIKICENCGGGKKVLLIRPDNHLLCNVCMKLLGVKIPAKKEYTADGIKFDSEEELNFYYWCLEAQKAGYIAAFMYHPEPLKLSDKVTEEKTQTIQLKRKTKTVNKVSTILHEHSYHADFGFILEPKFAVLNHGMRIYDGRSIYIDIKGSYEPVHSKAQVFSINRKWVYDKYGIFINKIVPDEFFRATWCPAAIMRHKITGRVKDSKSDMKTLEMLEKARE